MEYKRLHQNLPRLYDAMRKLLGMQSRACGLSHGQPRILDYLSHHNGCVQRDFCREYSLEASTVSNLLVSMEKDGLLVRERKPSTSRVVNVYITEEGQHVQQNLEPVYGELEKLAFEGLSEEEQRLFLSLLERITGNMLKRLEKEGA